MSDTEEKKTTAEEEATADTEETKTEEASASAEATADKKDEVEAEATADKSATDEATADKPATDEATADKPVEETTEAKTEEQKEETPKTEEASTEEETEEVEVPEKFKKLVEEVENMSVLELHELVKVLEKKFGVSASAVAVAAPGAAAEEAEEEKSAFTVELTDAGAQKIAVIKAVKEMLGLGLKEAKELVDGVPSPLKENVPKEEAEEIKAKIEEAGGKVELK